MTVFTKKEKKQSGTQELKKKKAVPK